MAQNDNFGNSGQIIETVCSALKNHEKELDGLICKLESNRDSLFSGLARLDIELEKIDQSIIELHSQLEQLKKLAFL